MIKTGYFRCALVLIVAGAGLSGCFPPYAPVEVEEYERSARPLHFDHLTVGRHRIFYAESGQRGRQLVLFIHGTPGSWQGYARYLQDGELTRRAHLIAMDRPGFGKSASGVLPSLREQAAILQEFSRFNTADTPMIVVGHSLGGTIAYRMAIDFPDAVAALVIVSASIDPELGKPRWYNRAASYRLVHWLLPDELARANREIMPLREELERMEPRLGRLTTRITVIQGDRDRLVHAGNLTFAERVLVQARFKAVSVPDRGHFLLWEDPDIVLSEILALLEP